MGVENSKLEKLFVSPEEREKGLGKSLIKYAVEMFSVREVTVNGQNPKAIGVYEHMDFMVYQRTDLGEEGRPSPCFI